MTPGDKSASNPNRSANLSLETELSFYRKDALLALSIRPMDMMKWCALEAPTKEEREFWKKQMDALKLVIDAVSEFVETSKSKK